MAPMTPANQPEADDGNKSSGLVYECQTCGRNFDPADQPVSPRVSNHLKSEHTDGAPVDWREFVELVSGGSGD